MTRNLPWTHFLPLDFDFEAKRDETQSETGALTLELTSYKEEREFRS